MLKFIQTGKTGGDCTCPYSVTSDTPLTVAELIQLILARKEWGYINFYYKKIDWVGVDKTSISKCLRGLKPQANGYKFVYYEREEENGIKDC